MVLIVVASAGARSMPHVESLHPSKCRLYVKWQDAPLGALLQIAQPEDDGSTVPTLSLRSIDLSDDPPSPCVIIVEGPDTGSVFYEEELGARPALDVREHMHLRINSPRPVLGHAFHMGGAYAHKDEPQIVWMFARYAEESGHLVCLHAPKDEREWKAIEPFGTTQEFVLLGHVIAVPGPHHGEVEFR